MPPISLAQKYYDQTEDIQEASHEDYLILYDFKEKKPNPKFWRNIKRLISISPQTTLIQYSALQTRSRRIASATKALVTHYGGEAGVYRVVEEL